MGGEGRQGQGRSRLLRVLQLVVLMAVVAVSAVPGWAVHDLEFALDGTATGTPIDWNAINPPVGGGPIPALPQGFTARVFVPQCTTQVLANACVPTGTDPKTVENPSTPGDGTYFQTGASKDENDVNQWLWGPTPSAPDKDEITNAYAVSFTDPATGDTIVYFGLDRFAVVGTSNVAFWFFANPVGLTGTTSGGFSGTHKAGVVDPVTGNVTTPGDIQVLSDFTNGGAVSGVIVRMWVGGTLGDPDHLRTDPAWTANSPLQLIFASATATCSPTLPAGDLACAIVNAGATTAPWRFIPKTGTGVNFPGQAFFEGGVNVSKLLGLSGEACISAFMAQTRSSASVTAQLKDFALGAFSTCGTITINKVTVPATDTTTQFGFTATGTGLDPTFSLTGGGPPNPTSTVTYIDLKECPGTECYTVTENDPAASGYAMTNLQCVAGGASTFTITNRTASINLAPSDSVACTYTNTKFGKIVVDKVTQPSGNTTSFSYTTTGTGYNGFSLKDTDTPNDSGPLTPGVAYTVTEGAVQGWKLSTLGCTSLLGTSTVTTDPTTRKATISNLAAGDTVTCTFTNTLQFRVAVIVCTNEPVPRFHASNVTIGGVTVPSASSGNASTLCTAAANFNNVTPGTKNLSVNILQNSPNTP